MQTSIASSQYVLTAADAELVLALVRDKTLAGAAERLGADASTVFRKVQRLEKALGQRLFERTRQGYLAGDAALEVARHAERIEAEMDAMRTAVAGNGTAVTGRVRITTTDAVLRGLLMPMLPGLRQQHPRLTLEIRTGNELVNLTRRDADLAVRATTRPPEHLVGRHLGSVRFVVARAAEAGARRRRRAPTAEDLAAMPWLAPDDALPDHPTVRWRRRHHPRIEPALLLDGITAIADGIAAGLGVGCVPSFIVRRDPRLVALTADLDDCDSQLWLLAHPESRHLRRIEAVYRALADGLAP